jgi:hypothetical protein
MKHLLNLILAFTITLTACDKGDGPAVDEPVTPVDKGKAPTIGSLSADKTTLAIGQVVTITAADVLDADTEDSKLTYTWTSINYLQKSKVATFVPTMAGQIDVKLTVYDGVNFATKTITFTVVAADFRVGVWGDSLTDILAYEAKAGSTLISNNGTKLIYASSYGGLDEYQFNSQGKLAAGARIFLPNYSVENYNSYKADFENHVIILRNSHGVAQKTATYLNSTISASYQANRDLFGQYFAAGLISRMASYWDTPTSNILLSLHKSNGAVVFWVLYGPKGSIPPL